MSDNRQLGDGVELVREDIFYPEGCWSIRKDDMAWSHREGWRKYYDASPAESHFHRAEDAIKSWETR